MRALQPLSRRLPLLLTGLLSAVVVGVSWASYAQIKRATVAETRAHLESAAHQVASLLDVSLRRMRNDVRPLASDPRVIAALGEAPGVGDAALSVALASWRQQSPRFLAVAVLNRAGARIAGAGPAYVADGTATELIAANRRSGAIASRFVTVRDTVFYALIAPVTRLASDTTGYVVASLAFADSSNTSAITKLIAPGARLLLGSGDVWTDLRTTVAGPPAAAVRDNGGSFTDSAKQMRVGAMARVTIAPWAIWIDVPEAHALATARGFLDEILLAGLGFVLIGAAGTWWIVRHVTDRLEGLRGAAEVLALGLSPDPVEVHHADEIGELARSFNSMANRVHAANRQIAERAEALERQNEELRHSEARYRQLIDQSPDAVVVHRDGQILFANAVAAQMLGAPSLETLIGKSVLDFVDAEQREKFRGRFLRVQSSKLTTQPAEVRLHRLDGTPLTVEVNGAPIILDGEPAVQTLARDISDRKQLEEQLRQSQKMEAVGRLAGGIAHDFNNLLTIINTYAELTLAQMAPGDAPRADIEAIHSAGMSAAKLTRQMLAFSRKQVLAPRVIDINDAITGLATMLARVLGAEVSVATELRPDLAPIFADPGQLEQVLMNLAVNARDAMPGGGTLRIETAEVELDEGNEGHRHFIPAGRYVMLCVSDNGVGMTEEVRSHIFEPFFTTKQPGRGTGLGLATVYGIVQQSGGYIWVYSEPGRGTSFKIYFPLHTDAAVAIPSATGEFPVPARETATVLLVEDDAMVRAAVRRILERSPHTICEAESGPDAVEQFRSRHGRIDLIITDMVMPSMTGAELVRELREWNPDLRAIIMSGYSEEATSRDWKLPPNALFLEKPLSPSKLLRAVSDALEPGGPLA